MSFSITLEPRGRPQDRLEAFVLDGTPPDRAQKNALGNLGDRIAGREENFRSTLTIRLITTNGTVIDKDISVRVLNNPLPANSKKAANFIKLELPALNSPPQEAAAADIGGGAPKETPPPSKREWYVRTKSLLKAFTAVAGEMPDYKKAMKISIVAHKSITRFNPTKLPTEPRETLDTKKMLKGDGSRSVPELLLEQGIICNKEKLGEGSYGEVYKAEFEGTSGVVKILKNGAEESIGSLDRGEGLGILECPWLCIHATIIEFAAKYFYSGDPKKALKAIAACNDFAAKPRLVAVVSDYAGEPLDSEAVMKQLPYSDKITSVAQVAGQLTTAHAIGIAHRDVKLGNIVYDPRKGTTLVDLGLALKVDPKTGTFRGDAGSEGYKPPENCRNKYSTLFSMNLPQTTKVDVWSLGITLICFLSSKRASEIEDDDFHRLRGFAGFGIQLDPQKRKSIIYNLLQGRFYNSFVRGIPKLKRDKATWDTCRALHEELSTIINQMLAVDPRNRLSAQITQDRLAAFSIKYQENREALLTRLSK